jgi:methionyl-tRNA formyltransferase
LLADLLADWLAGRIEPQPQPAEGVTMTRPLKREDGRLDPHKSAAELERQIRAYQPWPGSWLEIGGERVVVWRAQVVDDASEGAVALPTVQGTLELLEVQPAGGRRMSGAEFARGRVGRPEIR